jgi:hypothetical protein
MSGSTASRTKGTEFWISKRNDGEQKSSPRGRGGEAGAGAGANGDGHEARFPSDAGTVFVIAEQRLMARREREERGRGGKKRESWIQDAAGGMVARCKPAAVAACTRTKASRPASRAGLDRTRIRWARPRQTRPDQSNASQPARRRGHDRESGQTEKDVEVEVKDGMGWVERKTPSTRGWNLSRMHGRPGGIGERASSRPQNSPRQPSQAAQPARTALVTDDVRYGTRSNPKSQPTVEGEEKGWEWNSSPAPWY